MRKKVRRVCHKLELVKIALTKMLFVLLLLLLSGFIDSRFLGLLLTNPTIHLCVSLLLQTVRLYDGESYALLDIVNSKDIYGWHTLTYLTFFHVKVHTAVTRNSRRRGLNLKQ